MKLDKTMTYFVKEQFSKMMKSTNPALLQRELFTDPVFNRANFLSLNLEKWMFIPCDSDGNVLDKPTPRNSNNTIDYENRMMRYLDEKERVIFEGFEVVTEKFIHDTIHYYIQIGNTKIMWNFNNKWVLYNEFKTIEDLIPYNLTITEQAVKTYNL